MEQIVFPRLGVMAAQALKDELQDRNLSFKEEDVDHGGHGELATMALVAGATAALAAAVGAWLLKTRHNETIEIQIKRRNADGSEETIDVKHKIQNEKEPSEEVVKAITEAFGLGLGS